VFTVALDPDGPDHRRELPHQQCVDVDLRQALAHDPGAEVARIPVTRPADADGQIRPGRPKGTAVTAGRTLRGRLWRSRLDPDAPPSGTVWVIDLHQRAVVATVTGVGNDPYGLTILEEDD